MRFASTAYLYALVVAVFALLAVPVAAQTSATTSDLAAACARNVGEACMRLGRQYTVGDSVAVDLERGTALFRRACTLGEPRGCVMLAESLQKGRGVPANPAEALAILRRSCARQFSPACNNAGQLYMTGDGVAKDVGEAISLFRQACALQNALGCRNVGVLHEDSTSRLFDPSLAMVAHDKGCSLGESFSCYRQGVFLERGFGATRDLVAARRLHDKACRDGYEQACRRAQQLPPAPAVTAKPVAVVGAPDGTMVCNAQMLEGRTLFITAPFVGEQRRAGDLAVAFATMLREKGYAIASRYAPNGSPPPSLSVGCYASRTPSDALAHRTRLSDDAVRNQLTVVPVAFDPK